MVLNTGKAASNKIFKIAQNAYMQKLTQWVMKKELNLIIYFKSVKFFNYSYSFFLVENFWILYWTQ